MNLSMQLNSSSWCSVHMKKPNQNATVDEANLCASAYLFWLMLPSETLVRLLGFIFFLMCLMSSIMNICTLFGLGRSDDLSWEPRFTMLKSLIISDLLFTFTQGSTVLYCLFQRRTLSFGTWCLTQYFVGTVCIFCVLLTITMLVLERYIYVCHAIHYLSILTTRRLRLAMALMLLLAVTFRSTNIILLLYEGHGNFGMATTGLLCEPDIVERHMGFPRAATLSRRLCGATLTLLCIVSYVFSYTRMYQEARNAVEPFHRVSTRAHSTVLFYCSMFVLQLVPCWFKVVSDMLWELQGKEAVAASLPTASPFWPNKSPLGTLHISLLMLLFVPPCINPLIFGIRNQEVRRALCRCTRCRQLKPVQGDEPVP